MIYLAAILFLIALIALVKSFPKRAKPTFNQEEKPDIHQNQAQPGQGVIENIKTRIQAGSDAKTQVAVNIATLAANEGIKLSTEGLEESLKKEALPDQHHEVREVEKASTKTLLVQHEAAQQRTITALEDGLSIEGKEQLLLAAGLSNIKVDEHQKLSGIDVENRWKEIVQDLDAADLLILAAQQVIKKLGNELKQARIERYEIETGKLPKPLKKQLLDDKDKDIAHLEEQISGWKERQTRLDLPEIGQETHRLTEGSSESE
jgi:hypothetical protein